MLVPNTNNENLSDWDDFEREVAEIVLHSEQEDEARGRDANPLLEALDTMFASLPRDETTAGESLTPGLPKRVIKKGRKRARRSRSRDTNFLRKTGSWRRHRQTPANGSSVGHQIPLQTPPQPHPTPANDNTETAVNSDRRAPPSWQFTTDVAKLWAANEALTNNGEAYAFTLNLGPAIEKAANDNKAGPMAYLERRIRERLKAALPDRKLLYWLSLELTKSGRLHVHGGISVPGPSDLPLVREALISAGGKWDAPGRQYQLDTRLQDHPPGWFRYSAKDWPRARKALRGQVLFLPNGLRALAKKAYMTHRSIGGVR